MKRKTPSDTYICDAFAIVPRLVHVCVCNCVYMCVLSILSLV